MRRQYLFVCLIILSISAVSACAQSETGETATTATVATPGQSLGIASVPNLRDLGGYTTSDGAAVAGGLVYRSNQLSGISPGDMEKLAALELRTAFDLRTAEEREARLRRREGGRGVPAVIP
jgi:protein-tyrosine phosphatase